MVKATLRAGVIQPESPLPDNWSEGQELIIEAAPPAPDDLDAWSREIDEMASKIPPEDFERLQAALAEANREAKEFVRRQMGLS